MLYRTYHQARQVENEIEEILNNYTNDTVFSEPWINGREKGFCFSGRIGIDNPIYIYVSENRNSDQLTVTVSKFGKWSMIEEREYKERKFFTPYAYREVAEFVLSTLGIITS